MSEVPVITAFLRDFTRQFRGVYCRISDETVAVYIRIIIKLQKNTA